MNGHFPRQHRTGQESRHSDLHCAGHSASSSIRGLAAISETANPPAGFFKFTASRLVDSESAGRCWKSDAKFATCSFTLPSGLRTTTVGRGVVTFFWGGALGGIFIS